MNAKKWQVVYHALFIICVIAFGCSRYQPATYTEDDVRKFVLPGTSREAINQLFGQPTVDEKNPKFDDGSTNIDEILVFVLPPESLPHGKVVFSGFEVRLKDGKAVNWIPTEGSN